MGVHVTAIQKLDKCFFGCKGKCSCCSDDSDLLLPLFDIRISTTIDHPLLSLLPQPPQRPLLLVPDPRITSPFVKMLRTGAVKALQAITRTQVPRQLPAFRSRISSSYLQSSQIAPAFAVPSIRCYSASAGLTKPEVQGRIMDLLKNFDKVRHRRIELFCNQIHFSNNVSGHRCIKGTCLKRACNTYPCC